MIIGKVVGSVISTRKSESLVGCKFLIVEPTCKPETCRFVAIDHVGAGMGETVLVALGSAARKDSIWVNAPVDAAIVGIVDDGSERE